MIKNLFLILILFVFIIGCNGEGTETEESVDVVSITIEEEPIPISGVEDDPIIDVKPTDDPIPGMTDKEIVEADIASLSISYSSGNNIDYVTSNIILTTEGLNGSVINWSSSDTSYITTSGVVTRPEYVEGNKVVTLTATIVKGMESDTIMFNLTVIKKDLVITYPIITQNPIPDAEFYIYFDNTIGTRIIRTFKSGVITLNVPITYSYQTESGTETRTATLLQFFSTGSGSSKWLWIKLEYVGESIPRYFKQNSGSIVEINSSEFPSKPTIIQKDYNESDYSVLKTTASDTFYTVIKSKVSGKSETYHTQTSWGYYKSTTYIGSGTEQGEGIFVAVGANSGSSKIVWFSKTKTTGYVQNITTGEMW